MTRPETLTRQPQRASPSELCAKQLAVCALALLLVACGASKAHPRSASDQRSTPPTPSNEAGRPNAAPEGESPNRDGERSVFLAFLRTSASNEAKSTGRSASSDDEFARALEVTLHVDAEGSDYGEVTRRSKAARLESGRLQVGALQQLESRDPLLPAHRSPSFLIDHDEPAVVEVARQARDALGEKPPPKALERFVHDFIQDKTASEFYTASQVGVKRSGDCKAHAVLLAALLRHFGLPARVTLGIALVGTTNGIVAAGHAWVELHEGGAWQRLDAALLPGDGGRSTRAVIEAADSSKTFRRAYIPLHLLDEGPGFGGQLLREHGIFHVERVELDVRR